MQSLRVRSTPHNGHRQATCSNETRAIKPAHNRIGCRVFGLYGKPIRFRLDGRGVSKGLSYRMVIKLRNQEFTQ